jgi:hypothetical protein
MDRVGCGAKAGFLYNGNHIDAFPICQAIVGRSRGGGRKDRASPIAYRNLWIDGFRALLTGDVELEFPPDSNTGKWGRVSRCAACLLPEACA